MNFLANLLVLILLISMGACSSEDIISEESVVNSETEITEIAAVIGKLQYEDSRTAVTMGDFNSSSINLVWAEKDTIGIYPTEGDQLSFPIVEGVGTNKCTFNGGGWALKNSTSYKAYSPFNRAYYYHKSDKLPVSMLGQKQVGNGNSDHLSKYDLQIAEGKTPETGKISFDFKHQVCFIRMDLTAPIAATWKSITLISDASFNIEATMNLASTPTSLEYKSPSNSITLELENVTTNSESPTIIAYMAVIPVDLTNKSLDVELTDTDGNTYTAEATIANNYRNFKAGFARWIKASPKLNYIEFEDVNVKALCLKWDTNHDGELSYEEATKVQSLGTTFKGNTSIRLFKELQYFTKLTTLDNAFNGCTNLTYINIPSSVTNMAYAFYGCTSLISTIVPNNVTDLSYAFYNCTSLAKSNISLTATNLNYSFYECNKLEGSLIIPNTATSLDVAFKNCYLVSEIKFENGSTITEFPAFERGTIGNWNKGAFDSTFRGCKSIKSFVVPASVEIINLSTFYECTSLETIQFEENSKLKRIISSAYDGTNTSTRSPFEDCISLKTFDARNCLNEYTFDQGTFYGCQSLTTVIMPKITEIGDEFNSALTTIEIPDVKEITSKAFANCTSLKNVTMQKIESIWESAFYGCTSLEKITLPSTIKFIGKMAFYGCESLIEVNCKAVIPPTLGDSPFYDVSPNIVINVPNNSLDDYKSSWTNYINYIKGLDL